MGERTFLLRVHPYVFDGPPAAHWVRGTNQSLPPKEKPPRKKEDKRPEKQVNSLVMWRRQMVLAMTRAGHIPRDIAPVVGLTVTSIYNVLASYEGRPEYEVLPGIEELLSVRPPDVSSGTGVSPPHPTPQPRKPIIRESIRPPFVLDYAKRMEAYIYDAMPTDIKLPKDKVRKHRLTPEQAREIFNPGSKRTRYVKPIR